MLPLELRGRRALVTGGARGIGRATALLLARAGCDVAIGYRSRHDEAAAVVAELERAGVRACAHAAELADPAGADALVARAVAALGGLDIFVGNAGVWPPEPVPVAELPSERWRATLAANLDGVFYSLRAAARVLADGGRIVLVGSTAGQRGEAGHGDYAATKGALSSLVKGVALELAPRDITVNCVAPGWVDTEMCREPFAGAGRAAIAAGIPLGRIAAPEDVAGPIVFLCSGLARHITGEVLNVNGGSVLCG
jgi:3-oxoacyl-[acyl-carrier protein] reductase